MYKLVNDYVVQRLSDGAFIPKNESNVDYREFLRWQAAGGVPEDSDTDDAP